MSIVPNPQELDKERTSSAERELTEARKRQRELERLLEEKDRLLEEKEQRIRSLWHKARHHYKSAQMLRVLNGELNVTAQVLKEQNEALTTQAEALLTSTSWRLSAPLRAVIGAARRLRQLGFRRRPEAVDDASRPQRRLLDYDQWIALNDTLTDLDREAIAGHISRLSRRPRISVVLPVFDPEECWLRAAIDSVSTQLYPDWELCIADDASSKPHVRRVLEEYQALDARIKLVLRSENGHISAASNSALALVSGEFLVFLDHDDLLSELALYRLAVELNSHPDACLIYSDSDNVDAAGRRYRPYFKPDWNPALCLGQNMVNHLAAYRTELVRAVGGLRPGYEGAQDWDLVLRVVERITDSQIRHLPAVLYHWRAVSGSTAANLDEKPYALEAARKALISHFERTGQQGVELFPMPRGHWRVSYPLPDPPPRVSVIIPTRNGYELLRACVESVVRKTDYPDYEIIIVDNASDDPRALDYLELMRREPNVRVLPFEAPFNFSAINNFAVEHSDGEVLALLNNDIEVISADWLGEMVSHAIRPSCGAVGAMLYYPDDRIQHAGVILGIGPRAGDAHGVAGHIGVGKPRGSPGHFNRLRLAQNLSAVTAACLVVRKSVFEQAGGFDETDLAIAYNDIDLCIRIRELGYRNLWTPFAELYHHESATRGYESTPEKQMRYQMEWTAMLKRWGEMLGADPAYNPNLDLTAANFQLAAKPRVTKPWLTEARPGH